MPLRVISAIYQFVLSKFPEFEDEIEQENSISNSNLKENLNTNLNTNLNENLNTPIHYQKIFAKIGLSSGEPGYYKLVNFMISINRQFLSNFRKLNLKFFSSFYSNNSEFLITSNNVKKKFLKLKKIAEKDENLLEIRNDLNSYLQKYGKRLNRKKDDKRSILTGLILSAVKNIPFNEGIISIDDFDDQKVFNYLNSFIQETNFENIVGEEKKKNDFFDNILLIEEKFIKIAGKNSFNELPFSLFTYLNANNENSKILKNLILKKILQNNQLKNNIKKDLITDKKISEKIKLHLNEWFKTIQKEEKNSFSLFQILFNAEKIILELFSQSPFSGSIFLFFKENEKFILNLLEDIGINIHLFNDKIYNNNNINNDNDNDNDNNIENNNNNINNNNNLNNNIKKLSKNEIIDYISSFKKFNLITQNKLNENQIEKLKKRFFHDFSFYIPPNYLINFEDHQINDDENYQIFPGSFLLDDHQINLNLNLNFNNENENENKNENENENQQKNSNLLLEIISLLKSAPDLFNLIQYLNWDEKFQYYFGTFRNFLLNQFQKTKFHFSIMEFKNNLFIKYENISSIDQFPVQNLSEKITGWKAASKAIGLCKFYGNISNCISTLQECMKKYFIYHYNNNNNNNNDNDTININNDYNIINSNNLNNNNNNNRNNLNINNNNNKLNINKRMQRSKDDYEISRFIIDAIQSTPDILRQSLAFPLFVSSFISTNLRDSFFISNIFDYCSPIEKICLFQLGNEIGINEWKSINNSRDLLDYSFPHFNYFSSSQFINENENLNEKFINYQNINQNFSLEEEKIKGKEKKIKEINFNEEKLNENEKNIIESTKLIMESGEHSFTNSIEESKKVYKLIYEKFGCNLDFIDEKLQNSFIELRGLSRLFLIYFIIIYYLFFIIKLY